MAAFQLSITQKGMDLLAKGLSGSEIRFLSLVMGDSAYTGSLTAVTAVISPRMTLPISRLIPGSGQVTVKGVLRFGEVEEGFFWREIGLMARDPDTEAEVLYAYGNTGAEGDYIPGAGEATLDERVIQLTVAVGEASSVTAQLDPSALFVEHSEMEEALSPLRETAILTLTCTTEGTTHALTGLGERTGLVPFQFAADAAFAGGNNFTVDGTAYTACLPDGSQPGEGFFSAGGIVTGVLDTGNKTVNFKAAGGGSSFPAGTYALCKGFRETEMWTVPSTGLYRLICIGRGGTGGNGVYTSGQSKPNAGGGGGGSGGWCAKTLTLTAGETYRMQVTISSSRIIKDGKLVMEATRGQNGGFGAAGTPGKGGAAGTASGGDENHDGFAGEDGGLAASGTGAVGGNGAATDWENLPQYLHSGYGVGAFQGENTTINGQSPYNPSCFSLAMGAGGGGGGARNSGGIGQSGSPGCIVVEYVLG